MALSLNLARAGVREGVFSLPSHGTPHLPLRLGAPHPEVLPSAIQAPWAPGMVIPQSFPVLLAVPGCVSRRFIPGLQPDSGGPERVHDLAPDPEREVCLGGWKVEGRMESPFHLRPSEFPPPRSGHGAPGKWTVEPGVSVLAYGQLDRAHLTSHQAVRCVGSRLRVLIRPPTGPGL